MVLISCCLFLPVVVGTFPVPEDLFMTKCILAYHITRSMIGYWHDTVVCLSVRSSVTYVVHCIAYHIMCYCFLIFISFFHDFITTMLRCAF